MFKIINIVIVFFPILFFSQSQNIYYNELPNFINGTINENLYKAEFNFNLGNKQFELSSNIYDNYFVYVTYNYNNSTTNAKSFFGDEVTYKNKNSGYSLGVGYYGFGKIGNYNNLEVLIGFEKQNVAIVSYFSSLENNPDKQEEFLDQSYYKIFTQFNMIKTKRNYDSGFSLKLAYFKFTENPLYSGASNVFIAPSYSFNYKILKNRTLVFTSQVGVSIPTNSFKNSTSGNGFSSTESNYIVGGILKVGIQYVFKTKDKEIN